MVVTLQSDDVLAGESAPSSPPWQAVASGEPEHESRAVFALQLREPGNLRGFETFALLRVSAPLAALPAGEPLVLRDASSSLAVAVRLSEHARAELRVFPFDTDYLRLGYLHALDWGGTNVAARESVFVSQQGGAPGAWLAFDLRRARVFAAVKWATASPSLDRERLWGALAGAELEPSSAWRFDAGFGYFERPELAPGLGASELLEGASVRAVWRSGVPEPELSLEPLRRASFRQEALALAAPEAAEGRALALEATTLVQRQPLLEAAAETRLVPAPAAALYGSLRSGGWHAHAALLWASLRFVLRSERGPLPAPSSAALEHAELRAWLGGGVTLRRFALTPAVELGAVVPAALETLSGAAGQRQVFVAGDAGLVPLPPGALRLPVLAARVSLRFQASAAVALSLLADYEHDPNATRLGSDGEREFSAADRLSFAGSARARF